MGKRLVGEGTLGAAGGREGRQRGSSQVLSNDIKGKILSIKMVKGREGRGSGNKSGRWKTLSTSRYAGERPIAEPGCGVAVGLGSV